MAIAYKEVVGQGHPEAFIPQPYAFHADVAQARQTDVYTVGELTPRLGATLPLGDLADKDYSTVLGIINATAHKGYEASHNSAQAKEKIQALNDGLDRVRAFVKDESNYPENAATAIKARYDEADKETEGKDMLERIAARVAGRELHFLTDMDKTMTKDDSILVESPHLADRLGYLKTIPGSLIAEKQLEEHGRTIFPEVFVRVWGPLLEEAPALFELAGSKVELRSGVDNAFGYIQNQGGAVTVLTANFQPFAHAVMERIPNAQHIPVYSVSHDNLIATAKEVILEHSAKRAPHRAVIYAGDGSSDIPALDAQDLVAFYFALEDSSFAKALHDRKAAYLTYRDFNDITLQLEKIDKLSSTRYN